MQKTFQEGSVKNVEFTLLKRDGTRFPAELSASLIKDTDGRLIALIGVVRDITERKRAEEELKLYRLMVESAVDYAIFRLDPQGCCC